MINKKWIIAAIEKTLETELHLLHEAARAAHGGAIHEDAQAKGKYDTQALELSYLAGAQAERVRIAAGQLVALRHLNISPGQARATVGSLVTLKANGVEKRFFLCYQGAGISLASDGSTIKVISPESAVGEQMIEAEIGDVVCFTNGQEAVICGID